MVYLRDVQQGMLEMCHQVRICRVGQNHIYTRCIYGIFDREITKYTVIYSAYIWFWPTLRAHRGYIWFWPTLCN